jgi:hypothetical protein
MANIDPEVVIPAILAIGTGYALLPAAAMRIYDARTPRLVTCPDTKQPELVQISASSALRNLFEGEPEEVGHCARWRRIGDCDHACESQL